MKNPWKLFTCISYLMWYSHLIFCMQFLFYLFSTLMSFKVRLRLKLKVKTEISLCMAIMLDHPWQSLYTQYYRTVWLLEMMMSVLQEVKGLTKKLYFVILLVGRPVPMQNFRLNVYKVYLFWHRYSLHYNEMMMSVLQEVKGLTKKLYFVILLVGRPVPMQNFRLNVYKVYLFWHRYSLHYNVLSGPIIISFSRSKGVYAYALDWKKPVYTQNFKFIGVMLSEIHVFKRRRRRRICENHVLSVLRTLCDNFIQFFACSYFLTCSPPWCH